MDVFRDYEFKDSYKDSFAGAYKRMTRFRDDLKYIVRDINVVYGHIPRGVLYYDSEKDLIIAFENGPKDTRFFDELRKKYHVNEDFNYYEGTFCCVFPSEGKDLNSVRRKLWKLWDKVYKEKKDAKDINR